MLWLRNFSVMARLFGMIGLITVLLGVMVMLILNQHYTAQKEKAYEETRHLVEVATSVMSTFYQASEAGELSEAQAQTMALAAIKGMRYDTGNYFWIQNDLPQMVMHPIKPTLNGKDLQTFEDANGDRFFVAMAELVKSRGEGFVPYVWPLPGQEQAVAKISYVKRFAPWQWTVGSGIYLTRLDAAYAQMRNTFLISTLIIVSLVAVVSMLIGNSIVKPLTLATQRMKDIADGEGDLTRLLPVEGRDEVALQARYFNQFADKIRTAMLDVQVRSQTVSDNATNLSATSSNSARQVSMQSENTLQVAAAMEQMTTQIQDVTSSAGAADHSAENVREQVSQGSKAAGEVNMRLNALSTSANDGQHTVEELSDASQQLQHSAQALQLIVQQFKLA